MSQSAIPSPITIHHPAVGQMRLLASFPTRMHDFLTGKIGDGDIRCILHEGDHFVALDDVEPYSVTEIDDGEEQAAPAIISADAVAKLLKAIKAQADATVHAKRARLADTATKALSPSAPHPFAQVSWAGFWTDVAQVGVSVAGEADAHKADEAFAVLTASVENGTLETIGLPHFHRLLLSLAHPALKQRFDEIWSPGRGQLEMPQDPQAQKMALAILRRLTAMYSGYRGTPEGSETPQRAMSAYLQIVKLKPAL
jgi:hypothetical protein